MEVRLIKNLLHNIPTYKQTVPEEGAALDRVAAALVERDRKARDASAAAVTPVVHTLEIGPSK